MVVPEFIVPPPGLIPNAPERAEADRARIESQAPVSDAPETTTTSDHAGVTGGATDRTVRAAPARSLPTFTPLPSAPPAALAVPPAFQSTSAPVPPATAPVFQLVGPDGVEIEISGRVVLGRNPVADGPHADAHAIAVADPTRTVSKTHAFIEVRDGRVIVTDLHSTNGVAVQAGGGEITVLDAGAPAEVESGSVLRLGDLALTLRRASGLTV